MESQKKKRYEWFKGTKRDKNKKEKTFENLKITWKFVKAFLLIFTVFTALWGCGQSLSITNDNNVGRGLEIYQNESDVSPHITQFRVVKTSDTVKPDSIYLETTGENIWLQRSENELKMQVGAKVRKVIASQNDAGNLKMSDAFGGSNEAVSLVGSDKDTPLLFDGNNDPIVISTLGTKYNNNSKINYSLSIFNNPNKKPFQINPDNQTENRIYKLPSPDDLLLNPSKEVNFDEGKFGVENGVNNIDYFTSKIDLDNIATFGSATNDKPREIYRNLIFDALNNIKFNGAPLDLNHPFDSSWIIDSFTKVPQVLRDKTKTGMTYENLAKDDDYNQWFKRQSSARSVMQYLGFDFDDNNVFKDVKGDSFIPSADDDSYRPILTWDQAWVRGVGPFYSLAVYPIAKLTNAIIKSLPILSGWEVLISIISVVFILRIFGFIIGFKGVIQQSKLQELTLKKATIDAKYIAYKDNKQMQQRKNSEISALYRKEGINVLGSFTSMIIMMPIFFAVWRTLSSLPHIKSTTLLGLNFSATSWRELFAGHVQYLPLLFLALIASVLTTWYPRLMQKRRDKMRSNAHIQQAQKSNNRIMIIATVGLAVISVIFSAGIQIYSITVSIWMVIQTHLTHAILVWQQKRRRSKAALAKK